MASAAARQDGEALAGAELRRVVIALVAGWAVPGLGHAVIGRFRRGLIFAAIILICFTLGLLHDGRLSLRHNSGYARTAQRIESCPRLSEAQNEVMSLIDRLAFDEKIRFDVQLEEGDMLFINNYQVMHARSEFEDYEEPERRRHLMRLWLYLHRGRPLEPDFDNRDTIITTEGDQGAQ